jgi:AraC-like DNA-binding protein
MEYVTRPPCPALAGLVENLWWLGDAPTHARERIVPTGTFELVVNLAEDAIHVIADGRPRRHGGAVVSGAYTRSFDVDTRAHASLLGVHFRPGGARAFLGLDAGALANTHAELGDLWSPPAADRLQDMLRSAPGTETRFRILEDALLAHLRPAQARRPFLQALSFDLEGTVAGAAERMGLSQRSFIGGFRAEVGMTPKLYQRIRRMRAALAAAQRPDRLPWAQLALACGYCDQSHLIRDLGELAGFTPGVYARAQAVQVKADHVALA